MRKFPKVPLKGTAWAVSALAVLAALLLCICVGSVNIPLLDTLQTLGAALGMGEMPQGAVPAIILSVRLPRVLCVMLVGAALALCGAVMQGLLRNPLADGSTLGVSSGASLGAALALAFGLTIPGIPMGGTMLMAMVFAFLSLVLILSLAYVLDKSLSTQSIILIGVVFSMFCTSLLSLVMTFSGEKVRNITFWTMGSLAGSTMNHVLTMLLSLIVCGVPMLLCARELNAFAIGEDNARNIGVNVRSIKLLLMAASSALIGVCVSVGGSIGFVGLIIPHITRMVSGPNHQKLLPAAMVSGGVFLLLADLIGRTILRPLEIPIGVVTSLIGAVVFVVIFYRMRKGR